jgi:nucleotide-binding universal stress UspA family protein
MKTTRKFSPPSTFLKPVARAVLGRVKTSYPRLQHLLVPLDFSGKSRQALRYAVPLAEKFSAKIHLVHVLPPAQKKGGDDLPLLRAKAQRRLESMAALLLPPNFQTENLVLSGNPARQILVAAETVDADLILITTRGETGLRRVLLGSTAEHVMRHAKCPVVSIRRP